MAQRLLHNLPGQMRIHLLMPQALPPIPSLSSDKPVRHNDDNHNPVNSRNVIHICIQ